MGTRSDRDQPIVKDDVSCLLMPSRHSWIDSGTSAPSLLRAVAEAENVLRVATKKLHVSEPGGSRQIRDLEDELDGPLFERTRKAVNLTDAGRVFLREARAVIERTDEAVKNPRLCALSLSLTRTTTRFLPGCGERPGAARVCDPHVVPEL